MTALRRQEEGGKQFSSRVGGNLSCSEMVARSTTTEINSFERSVSLMLKRELCRGYVLYS